MSKYRFSYARMPPIFFRWSHAVEPFLFSISSLHILPIIIIYISVRRCRYTFIYHLIPFLYRPHYDYIFLIYSVQCNIAKSINKGFRLHLRPVIIFIQGLPFYIYLLSTFFFLYRNIVSMRLARQQPLPKLAMIFIFHKF